MNGEKSDKNIVPENVLTPEELARQQEQLQAAEDLRKKMAEAANLVEGNKAEQQEVRKENYYELLGLSEEDKALPQKKLLQVVNRGFNQRQKEYGENAALSAEEREELMKELVEAKRTVTDKKKRAAYDSSLTAEPAPEAATSLPELQPEPVPAAESITPPATQEVGPGSEKAEDRLKYYQNRLQEIREEKAKLSEDEQIVFEQEEKDTLAEIAELEKEVATETLNSISTAQAETQTTIPTTETEKKKAWSVSEIKEFLGLAQEVQVGDIVDAIIDHLHNPNNEQEIDKFMEILEALGVDVSGNHVDPTAEELTKAVEEKLKTEQPAPLAPETEPEFEIKEEEILPDQEPLSREGQKKFYEQLHPAKANSNLDLEGQAREDVKEKVGKRFYKNKEEYQKAIRPKVENKILAQEWDKAVKNRWALMVQHERDEYEDNIEKFKEDLYEKLVEKQGEFLKKGIKVSKEALFGFVKAGYVIEEARKKATLMGGKFVVKQLALEEDIVVYEEHLLTQEQLEEWIKEVETAEKRNITRKTNKEIERKTEAGMQRYKEMFVKDKEELLEGAFGARVFNSNSFADLYGVLQERRQIEGADGKQYGAAGIIETIKKCYKAVMAGKNSIEEVSQFLASNEKWNKDVNAKVVELLKEAELEKKKGVTEPEKETDAERLARVRKEAEQEAQDLKKQRQVVEDSFNVITEKGAHFTNEEDLRGKVEELLEAAKDKEEQKKLTKADKAMLKKIKGEWAKLSKEEKDNYKKKYLNEGKKARDAERLALLDFVVAEAKYRYDEMKAESVEDSSDDWNLELEPEDLPNDSQVRALDVPDDIDFDLPELDLDDDLDSDEFETAELVEDEPSTAPKKGKPIEDYDPDNRGEGMQIWNIDGETDEIRDQQSDVLALKREIEELDDKIENYKKVIYILASIVNKRRVVNKREQKKKELEEKKANIKKLKEEYRNS